MIAVGDSKYLKPTQSLLEEAISVGGKLVQVERTFEQYYHHMEEVVSSFEVIAGLGSGKSRHDDTLLLHFKQCQDIFAA
ncbi:hypothetical protein AgCh_019787 [Apium graveolens]